MFQLLSFSNRRLECMIQARLVYAVLCSIKFNTKPLFKCRNVATLCYEILFRWPAGSVFGLCNTDCNNCSFISLLRTDSFYIEFVNPARQLRRMIEQ
jgi:hypothetical protein